MSDDEEPQRPNAAREPGRPLPRLWKSEPESAPEEPAPDAGGAAKKPRDDAQSPRSKLTRESKSSGGPTNSAKGRASSDGKEGPEKKRVLIEETPSLDTYEARRRARLLVGGLSATSAVLFVWAAYRAFFYDPNPIDLSANGQSMAQSAPEPRLSLDQEARFMFTQAQDLAKEHRTDRAIATLGRVVKVYKGTPTASAAQAALDRSEKNLPLFPDRPIVVAEAGKTEPAPSPPDPPAVVAATPGQPQAAQGEAALVLPANPSESVAVAPSVPARAGRAGRQSISGRSPRDSRPISTPASTSRAGRW